MEVTDPDSMPTPSEIKNSYSPFQLDGGQAPGRIAVRELRHLRAEVAGLRLQVQARELQGWSLRR